ncbi:MAG: DsbA family protein [Rhodospirillaceae bacterium]|jgi:protein-disulfide isomerase|nr:DsbA family protein [Rhodospirillaceae bacterium]MBT5566655.1 DsbA family protein [Rhodospirillaceae bacterium]MBT6087979.1 DsbA family protein [Rhodospirillaceae bacterium]MBT7449437.1 DsbA family protein [Rhodospirillaceae bacterium]
MFFPSSQPISLPSIFRVLGCFAVIIGVLSQGVAVADDEDFSTSEAQQIKGLVREYILENPEIIAEAITLLQSKQETAKTDRQQANLQQLLPALLNPPENTVIGNPDGNVTVVEFFDYNCGYCKSMFETLLDTLQDDKELRLVLIEFPILGPNSVTASKAALASRNQDLYGPFHQAMLSHRGSLNEATIMTLARGVGLDINQLQSDMKDPDIDQIIERNRAIAQQLEINGTPAFVVGDTLVPGAVSGEQFSQLIKQVRSPG